MLRKQHGNAAVQAKGLEQAVAVQQAPVRPGQALPVIARGHVAFLHGLFPAGVRPEPQMLARRVGRTIHGAEFCPGYGIGDTLGAGGHHS